MEEDEEQDEEEQEEQEQEEEQDDKEEEEEEEEDRAAIGINLPSSAPSSPVLLRITTALKPLSITGSSRRTPLSPATHCVCFGLLCCVEPGDAGGVFGKVDERFFNCRSVQYLCLQCVHTPK